MSTQVDNELERLRKTNQGLQADVELYSRQVDLLRTELAETNQGVVALYAELEGQKDALREATELKSRFLSYMSHEFRTPLSSIRSIARILLDRMDGPLEIEQERQIQFIQGSALELSEMVDDLLDLAKIEAGRISISAEWFEMVDLFAALRGTFKPLLNNRDVTVILEEPNDLPRIYTDHKKLSQILRNYISNSLKFTERGEIRVYCQVIANEQVIFSVSDTGIGISSEFQAAIFNDFVQVESHLQKRCRGTGLGLSLCKRLAQLLGGRVSMESTPNVGSTFSVTIPIHYRANVEPGAIAGYHAGGELHQNGL